MKIAYDVDDFAPLNHRFDLLDLLRNRFPKFKITMFTVPWDIRLSPDTKGTPITEDRYKPWVEKVKESIEAGWLDISIHGLTHAPREFESLNYQEAKNRVMVAQKMFANVGIKTNDLFKAPQWLLSDDARKAVVDLGLQVVDDGYYNWNLKDEMPDKKTLIAHGHVQDEPMTMNGIEQSLTKLMKIPKSAKWVFLKDLI